MTTTLRPTFTTTVRMVMRIHTSTPNMRPPTHPPTPPSFTEHNVLVIGVPYLTHRSATTRRNTANLTRRQSNLRPTTLTSIHHSTRTSTPAQLPATPRLKLNIMYH